MERLNEINLKDYLLKIFPNTTWLYKKKFFKFNFKPTYRCDELKLCVMFDDSSHYKCSEVVMNDYNENRFMGYYDYYVIRVPYFIQLDKNTIKALFGIDSNITNNYPHGFFGYDIFPADFCEGGLARFEDEIKNIYNFIEEPIYKSIHDKASSAIDDYFKWSQTHLSVEMLEEETDIFDHISTTISLAYMSQEILSQTMYNGGKYTDIFN